DAPERIGLEGAVPARRLVIPGPHEGPTLDHNDPYAGVAVLGPRTDAENLGVGKLLECGLCESSCGSHHLNSGRCAREASNAGQLWTPAFWRPASGRRSGRRPLHWRAAGSTTRRLSRIAATGGHRPRSGWAGRAGRG